MHNIVIIGTSKIIDSHIKVLKKLNFNIVALCTTNFNSKNLYKLSKKHKIKRVFKNIKYLFNFLKDQKDFCFLLAPRIKDTEKILLKCLAFKKKIFVEKPLSLNLKFYKKLEKYKKKIFVGYNRIHFQNVLYLKEKLKNKKNLFISISCSEKNKKNILTNTCHLISIINEIFDKVRVKKVLRCKNFILAELTDNKKNYFSFRVNFNSPENFEIKIVNKTIIYILKPIEILSEYRSMERVTIDNINYYKPKLFKKINEFKLNKYKPGFLKQMEAFKNLVYKEKNNNNTLLNSRYIMKICKKIHG